MSSCEHLNTSICQKEATVVCLDCALVITENLSYDEVYIKKEQNMIGVEQTLFFVVFNKILFISKN